MHSALLLVVQNACTELLGQVSPFSTRSLHTTPGSHEQRSMQSWVSMAISVPVQKPSASALSHVSTGQAVHTQISYPGGGKEHSQVPPTHPAGTHSELLDDFP